MALFWPSSGELGRGLLSLSSNIGFMMGIFMLLYCSFEGGLYYFSRRFQDLFIPRGVKFHNGMCRFSVKQSTSNSWHTAIILSLCSRNFRATAWRGYWTDGVNSNTWLAGECCNHLVFHSHVSAAWAEMIQDSAQQALRARAGPPQLSWVMELLEQGSSGPRRIILRGSLQRWQSISLQVTHLISLENNLVSFHV
jgi:phage gp46-like protein